MPSHDYNRNDVMISLKLVFAMYKQCSFNMRITNPKLTKSTLASSSDT